MANARAFLVPRLTWQNSWFLSNATVASIIKISEQVCVRVIVVNVHYLSLRSKFRYRLPTCCIYRYKSIICYSELAQHVMCMYIWDTWYIHRYKTELKLLNLVCFLKFRWNIYFFIGDDGLIWWHLEYYHAVAIAMFLVTGISRVRGTYSCDQYLRDFSLWVSWEFGFLRVYECIRFKIKVLIRLSGWS